MPFRPLLMSGLCILAMPATAAPQFFGPVHYTSAADTPAGFADGETFIEDFEDGVVDPRLHMSSGSIFGPGGISDSVDADDGVIDGSGSNGRSFFTSPPLTISFDAPYPRSAGMVWTDGGFGAAVSFEAFTPEGASMGVIGPFVIGDNSNAGGTDEDHFFGVRAIGGVGSIRISHNTGGLEIDHVQFSVALPVEPAIVSTLEDGDFAVYLPTPGSGLPSPAQQLIDTQGVRPHGLALVLGKEPLFADFNQPRLLRPDPPNLVDDKLITLAHRSNGNGTLAVEPNGRYAISVGMASNGAGEGSVLDFSTSPPTETALPAMTVLPFVTAAIDFDPQGRAFICHTTGVSVLSRPYTSIDFTMPFPPALQSPSMCRLTRDGRRLFVTRMLSESGPSVNGVRTATAPFSASSPFTVMPAPADVQGLGPMAVSPDGQALIVGQQFLFPPDLIGTRARAFLLRAPFDGSTSYEELTLPASTTGENCTDAGSPFDCPGFEHIEVSAHGNLAVLTGNSNRHIIAGTAEGVRAVFFETPFNDATRIAHAVQMVEGDGFAGRGAGGVRFQPWQLFRDGLED